MRMTLFMIAACTACFSLCAEKESFVVKRKHAPSLSVLKEQSAQELGEIIKQIPKLQERLATQEKRLARIQKRAIQDLYDLLENKINDQELQQMVNDARSIRQTLNTDYESASKHCVAMLEQKNNYDCKNKLNKIAKT